MDCLTNLKEYSFNKCFKISTFKYVQSIYSELSVMRIMNKEKKRSYITCLTDLYKNLLNTFGNSANTGLSIKCITKIILKHNIN